MQAMATTHFSTDQNHQTTNTTMPPVGSSAQYAASSAASLWPALYIRDRIVSIDSHAADHEPVRLLPEKSMLTPLKNPRNLSPFDHLDH